MSDRRPEMWMPCEHGMLHEHFWNYPPGEGEQCPGGRWAESADLLAVVRRGVESGEIKGEVEWHCFPWEDRQGVSEPCEAGSTHVGDTGCHWRLVIPVDGGEDE